MLTRQRAVILSACGRVRIRGRSDPIRSAAVLLFRLAASHLPEIILIIHGWWWWEWEEEELEGVKSLLFSIIQRTFPNYRSKRQSEARGRGGGGVEEEEGNNHTHHPRPLPRPFPKLPLTFRKLVAAKTCLIESFQANPQASAFCWSTSCQHPLKKNGASSRSPRPGRPPAQKKNKIWSNLGLSGGEEKRGTRETGGKGEGRTKTLGAD